MSRTQSDVLSGQDLGNARTNYERYPNFSTVELDTFFAQFTTYDIDDTGFVSAENLEEVSKALGCDMTAEQVKQMLDEVSILSGHENDGKLSFRDFMGCIQYERDATAHNSKVQADEELAEATAALRLSQAGASGEGCEAAPAADEAAATEAFVPQTRMRHSSFSVMHTLAKSRIATFPQVVEAAQQPAPTVSENKFARKLCKFQALESGETAKVNNETMQKAALKTKLAAFESASKADPGAFKKSWRNVKHGAWAQKTTFAGGPAPKKTIEQLMQERG